MSERCSNTAQLKLYVKDESRGTTLFNVEVLCDGCNTSFKEALENSKIEESGNPRLNEEDLASAYLIAGNRCQCDNDSCH